MLLAFRGSLTTFLALHSGVCLCRGGGKWLTTGSGPSASLTELPEQSQGCLWSSGTLSSCPKSCPEEGDHICMVWLWGHSSFTWAMQLGGRKQEHSLPASKLTICGCSWNRWLFCTHYGTFFTLSYMIVRFLFHFLLLKSGSVSKKVWECQSLLSFTGKIAKKTLWERQLGILSQREDLALLEEPSLWMDLEWNLF